MLVKDFTLSCYLCNISSGWLPAMHTTRSCRGKCPSWRNATCERFYNRTFFISIHSFLCNLLAIFVLTFLPQTVFSILPCQSCLFCILYFIFFFLFSLCLSFFPHPLCRSLMEQLRRLQALVMNTSNKPAQAGTCVLV